jgi:hypothetical protein
MTTNATLAYEEELFQAISDGSVCVLLLIYHQRWTTQAFLLYTVKYRYTLSPPYQVRRGCVFSFSLHVSNDLFSIINLLYRRPALIVWDCILCLPREIELVWGRKMGPLAWFYLLSRYPFFIYVYVSLYLETDAP